jgi:hypothetical protein
MATRNRKFTPPDPIAENASAEETAAIAGTEGEQWEETPVLTLGGKPIPPEVAHLVPYANTDQGIAERKAKRTHEPSGITFGRDPVDKKLDRMADFDDYDPYKELSQRHAKPGMVHRMLSPTVIKRKGMRGWQPVKEEDGQPAKHGDMILAEVPAKEKARRDRRLELLNRESLQEAAENFAEESAKAIRDSGVMGVAPLTAGDHLNDWDSSAETTIGRSSSRGIELAA